jgi:hypothetical protein
MDLKIMLKDEWSDILIVNTLFTMYYIVSGLSSNNLSGFRRHFITD